MEVNKKCGIMGKLHLFSDLKITWFEQYIWFPICRRWNYICDIPREIKWFWQRGRRGYADCDIWDMSDYLTDVMIGMLENLREYNSGFPAKLTECEWLDILLDIQRGFIAKKQQDDLDLTLVKKEYNKQWNSLEKEFKKSMGLLTIYWGALWD